MRLFGTAPLALSLALLLLAATSSVSGACVPIDVVFDSILDAISLPRTGTPTSQGEAHVLLKTSVLQMIGEEPTPKEAFLMFASGESIWRGLGQWIDDDMQSFVVLAGGSGGGVEMFADYLYSKMRVYDQEGTKAALGGVFRTFRNAQYAYISSLPESLEDAQRQVAEETHSTEANYDPFLARLGECTNPSLFAIFP